jgi:hypothetical protein
MTDHCPHRYVMKTPKFPQGAEIILCSYAEPPCPAFEPFDHGHDIRICCVNCYGYCNRRDECD